MAVIPPEYDPDNLLGNVVAVLSERSGRDAEDIARMIADYYGEGDYGRAEFLLWDRFGKLIDGIQDDLELEWA